MDWGLFERQRKDSDSNKEYQFLREEIVYSSPNYYYVAIISDLILRFGWTLSVSLIEIGLIRADLMVSILAPVELFRYKRFNQASFNLFNLFSLFSLFNLFNLFRRFVWNFFRLENEHLNNCGEFRAVRDISIAPMLMGNRDKRIENGKFKGNLNSEFSEIEMNTKSATIGVPQR